MEFSRKMKRRFSVGSLRWLSEVFARISVLPQRKDSLLLIHIELIHWPSVSQVSEHRG